MLRRVTLTLAFVAGIFAHGASAQSAAPPVELGLDLSATLVPDRGGLQRGPRLVVNFDGRNSVQFTASLQKLSAWDDFAQRETDLYLAAYRRLVHVGGPVRVVATLGGGLERTVISTPAITFGSPPVTFPSSRGVEILPAVTTGAAIDVRLGSRAAIVFESSLVFGNGLGGRLSGGLVVPVGSYASRPDRLASRLPWVELDAGERAWVTTADGREVDGEVAGVSATILTLRTRTGLVTFGADDVHAIDTTDSIRNGVKLGATIGGLGALVPSVLITAVLCTLEDGCSVGEVFWVNGVLVGVGAGAGAAIGALADSLRERRVPLFRRGRSARLALAPIVGKHRLGGQAVIGW